MERVVCILKIVCILKESLHFTWEPGSANTEDSRGVTGFKFNVVLTRVGSQNIPLNTCPKGKYSHIQHHQE